MTPAISVRLGRIMQKILRTIGLFLLVLIPAAAVGFVVYDWQHDEILELSRELGRMSEYPLAVSDYQNQVLGLKNQLQTFTSQSTENHDYTGPDEMGSSSTAMVYVVVRNNQLFYTNKNHGFELTVPYNFIPTTTLDFQSASHVVEFTLPTSFSRGTNLGYGSISVAIKNNCLHSTAGVTNDTIDSPVILPKIITIDKRDYYLFNNSDVAAGTYYDSYIYSVVDEYESRCFEIGLNIQSHNRDAYDESPNKPVAFDFKKLQQIFLQAVKTLKIYPPQAHDPGRE